MNTGKTDVGEITDVQSQLLDLQVEEKKIFVYLLRNSKIDDNFKIRADFESDIHLDFNICERLHSTATSQPCIHILQFDADIDQHNRLIVNDKVGRWQANAYKLRLGRKIYKTERSYRDYKDEKQRFLFNPELIQHSFLFDIYFKDHTVDRPPGSNTSFWAQPALYTSYLLHYGFYDLFDVMMGQFIEVIHRDRRIMYLNDFQEFLDSIMVNFQYSISTTPSSFVASKILFRLVGYISLSRDNFNPQMKSILDLTTILIGEFSDHHEQILGIVTDEEWPSFRNGLSIFMVIQAVTVNENTIQLIRLLKKEIWRRDLANLVLQQLAIFQLPVLAANWTELFSFVDPAMIDLKQLGLARSVETYVALLIVVLSKTASEMKLTDRIIEHFDRMIYDDRLMVNLDSIIFLIDFLSQRGNNNDQQRDFLPDLCYIIEQSETLRAKIRRCLYELRISAEQFPSVQCVLSNLSKYVIFYNVKKDEALTHLLENTKCLHSAEFLQQWFKKFLTFDEEPNEANLIIFKKALDDWSKLVLKTDEIYLKILQCIDGFLDALKHQPYREVVIKYFVNICFVKGFIDRVIAVGLFPIRNPEVLDRFKKRFAEIYFTQSIEKLKQVFDLNNPLNKLMKISEQCAQDYPLVNELVEIATANWKFTREEIIQDAFKRPSATSCVYTILFKSCFRKSKVRQLLIDEFLVVWNIWEEDGLRASEILCWNRFSQIERGIVEKIWKLLGEIYEKQFDIRDLIEKQQEDMKKKIEIKENIVKCLENSCNAASDKNHYLDILFQMEQQLRLETVQSVRIPSEILALIPFATRLNAVAKLNAWKRFLIEQQERSPTTDSSALPMMMNSIVDNDVLLTDNSSLSEGNQSLRSSISVETTLNDTRKCREIVEDHVRILDTFIARWGNICDNWKNSPIAQVVGLFPNMKCVDHDLAILKNLNPKAAIDDVRQILHFWKDRKKIRKVCEGWKIIFEERRLPMVETIFGKLKDLCTLDETAPGIICSTLFESYQKMFSNTFSSNLLRFIAEHQISNDLIIFINSLTTDDADNLLQAVNDWDETLIKTKTVLDLVQLKRFFVHFETELKKCDEDKLLDDFQKIAKAFEVSFHNQEYQDIFSCFETCRESLNSIKRIHLELTDKELAKRGRISDIMRQSQFYFIEESNGFNIRIDDLAVGFADLSELRDRARLMEHSINHQIDQYRSNTKQNPKELASFVILVELIDKTLKNLTSLNLSAYPNISDYLHPNKIFKCIDGNYEELANLTLKLDELLLIWEKNLCEMYEIHLDLTYFAYQQIWTVEDYLYNTANHLSRGHHGFHLLKFIGIDPTLIDTGKLPPLQMDDPMKRLENVGQILSSTRPLNSSPITESQSNKKVFLVESSDQGVFRAILSLFQRFETKPAANHLFYCRNETSWIEIRAFAYRCFFSQNLHQLIRPELLSATIQDHLTNLLREFIDQRPNQYFRLAIITTESSANLQLINGLRTLRIVHLLHDSELLTNEAFRESMKKILEKNSVLVTSELSGLGKSTFIRRNIEKENRSYLKFPISGDIEFDLLAERLLKATHLLSILKSGLHIDLGVVNQVKRLNELLCCLLIFRSCRLAQIAVSLPDDFTIYVELDSSPMMSKLHKRIVCFQSMTTQHFNSFDWKRFEIIDLAGTRLVTNYLQAIENKTILNQLINGDNAVVFEEPIIVDLLKKRFVTDDKPEFFTWIKCSIFIAVYNRLFRGFSRCGFFFPDSLPDRQLRYDLLNALLSSAKQFTSLSVEDIRKNQRSVQQNDAEYLFSDAIVRWNNTQPFSLIFDKDDFPIFIYKSPEDVPATLKKAFRDYHQILTRTKQNDAYEFFPDYRKFDHKELFLKLVNLSKKYFNKAICKKCFRQFPYEQRACSSCETQDQLIRPNIKKSEEIVAFQKYIAELLQSEYVLTPDNYLKMLLIYMRVESKLPVLIMGETGCGKTALIQFLCSKILDDELEVFRIHAGITNDEILERMKHYCQRAEELEGTTEIQRANQCIPERLWLFFDEFNTTPSIGLIKEIMCERTLLGKPLPKNIVLLGACNPQRRKTNIDSADNVGIKKDLHEMQRVKESDGVSLLYTVVPIPESMLEYIWDYGYLDMDTESAYIKTMLNACTQLREDKQWLALTVVLISKSQDYFRQSEDVSSVSLRDVARFCRLYNWFRISILTREGPDKFQKNSSSLVRRSTLSALLLCYYFRLNSRQRRIEYSAMIEENIKPMVPQLAKTPNFLTKILQGEQEQLVKTLILPAGTAKNRALMDNIFVLLVCIVNRIPVILCGKPGCSKTSAVQIVISNLRGQKSLDPYLQTLPELMLVSYQGSQNCTSESIIKVFRRADKYLDTEKKSNFLPVIVFDEIGLAELSPHNPLKVLHSKLEVETCQYGFVGLSNWRLDASKMNRTLYLSCPEPDIEDLKITAKTIADSIVSSKDQMVPIDPIIIPALAESYYYLYERLNTRADRLLYANYFGLRDFYSLIKGVVNDLIQSKEQIDPYESIRRQLIINFDGLIDGSEIMWDIFCRKIHREHLIDQYPCPTFKELLDQRIASRRGRYLMLIAENESVIDYVERYLLIRSQTAPVRTLIGSRFLGDLVSGTTYTEEYNYRVLMDVILYAETNVTLVMRRMGHLYDNLYDLFNQNFSVCGQKKFCRIALGALYHPRCLVNDDFYCVVFVLNEDLARCDPPFLNRFEKHVVDMKSLVDRRQFLITETILNQLVELIPTNLNKHFPLLQHLFVDYSPDYICNLVIDAFHHLNLLIDDETNTNAVIDYCQKKLLATASFDLPLVLSVKSEEKHRWINEFFEIHEKNSFKYIQNQALQSEVLDDRIIYTYTQIYEMIHYVSDGFEEIKLSALKSELELTNKVKRHHQRHDKKRVLIIRIDYHQENVHLLILKHILLNSKSAANNRAVWLICHLQRNLLNQTTNNVSFNGWSTAMINDLNEDKGLAVEQFFNPSYRDLLTASHFQLSENTFNELIDRCLTRFRYIVSQNEFRIEINRRRNRIMEHFSQADCFLRDIIKSEMFDLIKNVNFDRFSDWRSDLLTNGKIIGTCRSFNDALQSIISNYLETHLLLILVHFEKYSLIDSCLYFKMEQTENSLLEQIWSDCLQWSMKNLDQNSINVDVIEMPLFFGLQLPCATNEYAVIQSIRRQIHSGAVEMIRTSELKSFVIDQLISKSIYGKIFETILQNQNLFRSYYNDQLILAQNEGNLLKVSSNFLRTLFTTNPTRENGELLKNLIVDYDEFLIIGRLFQSAFGLINENDFIQQVINEQMLTFETDEKMQNYRNSTIFYQFIFTGEQFVLVPPNSSFDGEKIFQSDGDCFVEISIMNLIEYLVSRSTIGTIDNFEEIITTYNVVSQTILKMSIYSPKNFEKIRSFISLIRCITSVVSMDVAISVFRSACVDFGFTGIFENCSSIDEFIQRLKEVLQSNQVSIDDKVAQQNLWKLEAQLLKSWLMDHQDEYASIIHLLNQPNSSLWYYSGKMFQFIQRPLQALWTIHEYRGLISTMNNHSDQSLESLSRTIEEFDENLSRLEYSSKNIVSLLTTRLHMQLIIHLSHTVIVDEFLEQNFRFFEENVREIENAKKFDTFSWISMIVWVKCYAQLYAISLDHGSSRPILDEIDQFLRRDDFRFCSTLKLFIVKQLCQLSNKSLNNLREDMNNLRTVWIQSTVAPRAGENAQRARQRYILPTPLFECNDEFRRVDRILTLSPEIEQIRTLIQQCKTQQDTSYSFLLWFIHYYARFASDNETSQRNLYGQFVERDFRREILDSFQTIGYRFLAALCNNFNNSTYFSLSPTMKVQELNKRFVALNLIALIISFNSLSYSTYFSNFLFNERLTTPDDYSQYFQSSICFPGFIINDPIVIQMLEVRHTVQERLNLGQIHSAGKFIFQCSQNCLWTYYFVNCGVPVDRSTCPICKSAIGAAQYGILLDREPPQIRRTIEEAFQFIDEYLETFNRQPRYGLPKEFPLASISSPTEKSTHVNRAISHRLMHFFTHTTLFFLDELELLGNIQTPTKSYFLDHFERDYSLIAEQIGDPDQAFLWLYKLFEHTLNKKLDFRGLLNTNDKVTDFEKYIETNLFFEHLDSAGNDIDLYKTAYSKLVREQSKEATLEDLVDELVMDEEKYPHLIHFNVTNILTNNPVDEFRARLDMIPYVEKKYPVTVLLMKRMKEYSNIQYLSPIINFTNHLIDKFNHRIKRVDASVNTIDYYFTHGTDCERFQELYESFLNAWSSLKLDEVQYGCRVTKYFPPRDKDKFAHETKLAMFLLNTSKDESSILLAACLKTLAEYQNEIVRFFHKNIVQNQNENFDNLNSIPIQSIQSEHTLRFDHSFLADELIEYGLTLNHQYGKSKRMIFDFEEIEMTLRNAISSLPLIDTEHMRFLNYQFELYSENSSLINEVRRQVPQQSMKTTERNKLKSLLVTMKKDDLLHYLGSLDYVFTYLRNMEIQKSNESLTIQRFVERSINSRTFLNDHVIQRPPFATIELKFIIDLYELIEECAFDNVLRQYVKPSLSEESFPVEQRTSLLREFRQATFMKDAIAVSLKNIDYWIGILKRLMVRVLSNVHVSVDVPIQLYLERTDLWPGLLLETDLQTFEVSDTILLQHTYILLRGLEEERDRSRSNESNPDKSVTTPLQNSESQLRQTRTWCNQTSLGSSTRTLKFEPSKTKNNRL